MNAQNPLWGNALLFTNALLEEYLLFLPCPPTRRNHPKKVMPSHLVRGSFLFPLSERSKGKERTIAISSGALFLFARRFDGIESILPLTWLNFSYIYLFHMPLWSILSNSYDWSKWSKACSEGSVPALGNRRWDPLLHLLFGALPSSE